MKYTLLSLAIASTTAAAAQLTPVFQQHDKQTHTKRYLVKFAHDISPLESPLVSGEQRIHNLRGTAKRLLNKQDTIAAELTEDAVKQLSSDPSIEFIEEDPIRELASFGKPSYGVTMVQAPLVSDAQSSSQKVCVIDTGYDSNHEDLPSGANVTGETLDLTDGRRSLGDWFADTYGHGTHITGTIAALNNSMGIQGILPNGALNIHHVKIIDHPGYWRMYGSDLIAAVNACASAGSTVSNMSIAGWKSSQIEQDAMKTAYDNGMLLVAAGGNFGSTQYAYPASYDSVIAVGAVDENESAWMFTQSNDQIELVAPGVGVRSTLPNNRYGSWDGTSVAAPHISGVAALAWSHYPDCDNTQIREALNESAKDLGAAGRDNTFGYGLVQAKAAFDWLESHQCVQTNKPAEASEYDQVYGLNIPNQGSYYYNAVPYDVDNTNTNYPNGIERVAYHMQLQKGNDVEWVWVSFDAHTQTLTELGVPTHQLDVTWNRRVNNIHVFSNSNNLTTGNFPNGSIEFWPFDYRQAKSKNLSASSSTFDFDDTPYGGAIGHGSMQLHNIFTKETLFSYNYFNRNTSTPSSLGIGSRKTASPDWTFAYNANHYSAKRIEVWVKPAQ